MFNNKPYFLRFSVLFQFFVLPERARLCSPRGDSDYDRFVMFPSENEFHLLG